MKTYLSDTSVEFSYLDSILLTLEKSLFTSLWPERLLQETAQRLQKRYKEVSGSDKPQAYFEDRLIDVLGQVIEETIEARWNKEGRYIQAFLKYHIRTLRAIRKLVKTDKEVAAKIDNEIYNIQHVSEHDLHELLESVKSKNVQ